MVTLYHGSRNLWEELRPLSETGNPGPTDGDREEFRDVIFLTKDIAEARKYAGAAGYVYRVEAEAEPYMEVWARAQTRRNQTQAKKKLRRLGARGGRNIYVAGQATILAVTPAREINEC